MKKKILYVIIFSAFFSASFVFQTKRTLYLDNNSISGDFDSSPKTSSGKTIFREFNEVRVNHNTTDNQWFPSICALSSDRFAVAWTSDGQDGSDDGVYARVFNATTGENVTREFRVNHHTLDPQNHPSICNLSSDKFAVAWTSGGQDGDGYGVYARVFNATTGNNITNEFRVNHNTTNNQHNPSICALSSDIFAVTWESEGQDGDGGGVYARVFNATTGNNITNEFRVNQYTTSTQENPSICALSNETLAVAWTHVLSGADYDVYARVFNATTGNAITKEFRLNQYTTSWQADPSICALSNETLAVAWTSSGQDGDGVGVYARVFNATSSESLTSEYRVNQHTTNNQYNPSICALSNDTFVIAWTSEAQDMSGTGVYGTVLKIGPSIPSSYIGLAADDDDDDDEDMGIVMLIIIVAGVGVGVVITVVLIKKIINRNR